LACQRLHARKGEQESTHQLGRVLDAHRGAQRRGNVDNLKLLGLKAVLDKRVRRVLCTTARSSWDLHLVPLVDELALVLLLDEGADRLAGTGAGQCLNRLLQGDCRWQGAAQRGQPSDLASRDSSGRLLSAPVAAAGSLGLRILRFSVRSSSSLVGLRSISCCRILAVDGSRRGSSPGQHDG